MPRILLLAFCALALVLPACDSAEDDGSFTIDLFLPDPSSLSGDAYYAEERNGATSTFVLFLTPDDLEDFDDPEFEDLTAIVIRREGPRPNPGLTLITDPDSDGIATAFYINAPSRQATSSFVATSGSLTIDEFEDGELKGSFTFSGPFQGSEATIEGEFEAVRIIDSDLPDLARSLPTAP